MLKGDCIIVPAGRFPPNGIVIVHCSVAMSVTSKVPVLVSKAFVESLVNTMLMVAFATNEAAGITAVAVLYWASAFAEDGPGAVSTVVVYDASMLPPAAIT